MSCTSRPTLPQDDEDWSLGNDEYAYIDLGVALPTNIPVEATDSSGDAAFEDLKALHAAGQLRRPARSTAIAGLADVSDSSGDIEIDNAGSVRVRDSSGDIEVDEVRGDVEVMLDSSGDIHIAQVDGSVRVQQDSSGGIRIEDVKGSVEVDSDSSGDIYAGRVGGDFTVSEDSSGTHRARGDRRRASHARQQGRRGRDVE